MDNKDSIVSYKDEVYVDKAIAGWFYTVVGVIGFFSNVFIFDATLRKRKIKTPVYAFIVNLALTDCILAFLLCVNFLLHLNYGEVLHYFHICKILSFTISTTEFNQFFTLTAIIVTLFTKQPQRRMWARLTMVMCLLAWWYIAAHFAFPKAYYSEVKGYDKLSYCAIDYSTPIADFTLYVDALTTTGSLLVFLFIGFLVHKIKNIYQHDSLNRMLLVMVLIEVVLELPIITNNILRLWNVDFRTNLLLIYLPHMIFFLRVTYRPVLYILMDEDYRKKLKNLLSIKISAPVKAYQAANQEEI